MFQKNLAVHCGRSSEHSVGGKERVVAPEISSRKLQNTQAALSAPKRASQQLSLQVVRELPIDPGSTTLTRDLCCCCATAGQNVQSQVTIADLMVRLTGENLYRTQGSRYNTMSDES